MCILQVLEQPMIQEIIQLENSRLRSNFRTMHIYQFRWQKRDARIACSPIPSFASSEPFMCGLISASISTVLNTSVSIRCFQTRLMPRRSSTPGVHPIRFGDARCARNEFSCDYSSCSKWHYREVSHVGVGTVTRVRLRHGNATSVQLRSLGKMSLSSN